MNLLRTITKVEVKSINYLANFVFNESKKNEVTIEPKVVRPQILIAAKRSKALVNREVLKK
jgi:hypothetical protein